MRTLEQYLIRCQPARLAAIARFWGMDLPSARKGNMTDGLIAGMTNADEVDEVWETLPEAERKALEDLLSSEGRMPWPTFTRRWGEVRKMGPARMEREHPWEDPVSAAEGLWYRGLVFRDLKETSHGLEEVALVPRELFRLLPSPSSSGLRPPPVSPPSHVRPADDALLDDACTLLAYLQNHRVRFTSDGEWPARHLRGLSSRLCDSGPNRFGLLRHLVARLDWLRAEPTGPVRLHPEPVTDWLQASPREQRETLAAAWRDDPSWNDLWHVPSLQPTDTGSWSNDPLMARQAILEYLTACRPDRWYSLEGFAEAIKEIDPDFQRPDGDYASWYIRDAETDEYLSGFESWDAVEGALIRYLLTGPMKWLGLVDLGLERAEGPPVAFRLSAPGASFLGLAESQPTPEPPLLTIQADLTVQVPASRRYERFQLSRVADWIQSGDPYLYRLTPNSLERARRQGIALERILDFLARTTAGRLARWLERSLRRWDERGTEVRLERGVVLQTGDAGVMKELRNSPTIAPFIRQVIGPGAALVDAEDWGRLVEALVEEGVLPDLIGLEDQ